MAGFAAIHPEPLSLAPGNTIQETMAINRRYRPGREVVLVRVRCGDAQKRSVAGRGDVQDVNKARGLYLLLV
jgi:hypothetical protein